MRPSGAAVWGSISIPVTGGQPLKTRSAPLQPRSNAARLFLSVCNERRRVILGCKAGKSDQSGDQSMDYLTTLISVFAVLGLLGAMWLHFKR
jgi:hypothetical protein